MQRATFSTCSIQRFCRLTAACRWPQKRVRWRSSRATVCLLTLGVPRRPRGGRGRHRSARGASVSSGIARALSRLVRATDEGQVEYATFPPAAWLDVIIIWGRNSGCAARGLEATAPTYMQSFFATCTGNLWATPVGLWLVLWLIYCLQAHGLGNWLCLEL